MSDNYTEDVMLTEFESKILAIISLFNRPVTVTEISDEIKVPKKRVLGILLSLVNKGNLVEYASEKSGEKYYATISSKDGVDALFNQKYADIAGALEKQYEEIKSENANLKQKIDNMYANIITLMGIFVAIFALVVINVNAIGNYVDEMNNSIDVFLMLVKLNIPLVISIGILMLLIKFLITSKKNK